MWRYPSASREARRGSQVHHLLALEAVGAQAPGSLGATEPEAAAGAAANGADT